MIVVLVVILITVILGASLVSSAVWTSSHGRTDYAQKQALAVADAGLQAAINRLSNQAEDNATEEKECFTVKYVAEASGSCPPQPEELTKGEKYTYYVSPALSQSANHCTGLWLVVPKEQESTHSLNQRCITSIGTAGGSTARVQARVADLIVKPLFPVNGLFSYSTITITNKFTASGELGARETVSDSNAITHAGELTVNYGKEVKLHNSCAVEAVTCKQLTAEQLAAVPWALPKHEEAQEAPYAASVLANNNAKMTVVEATYNAATRELTSTHTNEVVLPSGTYNFCLISFTQGTTITYTPPVKLYLDSPYRKGSACSSGTGWLSMTQNVTWKDEAATPKASDLEIFAWGNPEAGASEHDPIFSFSNNSGGMYAKIYAPYSSFETTNNFEMTGSMVFGSVKANNQATVNGEGGGKAEQIVGTNFYVTAYHQCPSSYSGSPASGCY